MSSASRLSGFSPVQFDLQASGLQLKTGALFIIRLPNGLYQFRNTSLTPSFRYPKVETHMEAVDKQFDRIEKYAAQHHLNFSATTLMRFIDAWQVSALCGVLSQLAPGIMGSPSFHTLNFGGTGAYMGNNPGSVTGGKVNINPFDATLQGPKYFLLLIAHEVGHIAEELILTASPLKYSGQQNARVLTFNGKPLSPGFQEKIGPLYEKTFGDYWHRDLCTDIFSLYLLAGTTLREFIEQESGTEFESNRMFYNYLRDQIFGGKEYLDAS